MQEISLASAPRTVIPVITVSTVSTARAESKLSSAISIL